MAKRSHKSRGSKGSKTLVKCNNSRKKARNNHLTKDKFARSQSPSSSDDVHEEQLRSMASDDEAELDEEEMEEDEEVLVHKEPSMYDNLLKKLGTDNDWSTDMNKDRESDNEDCNVSEDDDRDSELSHKYNDEDDLEGPDNDYGRSGDRGTKLTEHSEEEEDSEASDAVADDDVSDLETELGDNNRGSVTSASQSHSSFSLHVGHKLSKDDIDNLLKRKWKYRWDVRAFDMKTCKWMGTGECSLKDIDATGAASYGLKLKLYKNWLEIYHAAGGNDFHSSRQRIFFSLCNSYRDILHHNKRPFYLRGSDEDSSSMDAYVMHVLNHLFRTRDLITKNDTKLARHQETRKEEVLTSDSFLDHGFTRPKVLILLPLASIALRLVRRLIQLIPSTNKVNVEYMDRFYNEFGADVEEGEVENASSKNNFDPQIAKLQKPSKPHDYQALFGANNNDHFMIGIKFTRKSIKLYSDFYSSDMIVASPLGLITKIGEAEVDKEKDVDYLSSIEILIIDHADVVTMQNWSHVNTVMEHLNRLPSKQHGTDIMRIRQWYLNEHAQFYRQTIVLSSYLNPDINALWNHNCVNFEGKLRLSCEYKGVLSKVILQVRQIYKRFDSDSIMEADDARLQYFVQKVFPKIKDSIQGGIMLFISSYFEFVRLRNFLKSQNASFCLLGEYTKQSDISRARNWFIQGQRKIMLYTERAHFYHRYKIRGIQNLIIYSLPERKEFYPEVINMLEGSQNMSCTVLFSRFDQFRLERIVGSSAAKRMVSSDKGLFVFC